MYRKPGVKKEGMSHLYELGLLCETSRGLCGGETAAPCSDTETSSSMDSEFLIFFAHLSSDSDLEVGG